MLLMDSFCCCSFLKFVFVVVSMKEIQCFILNSDFSFGLTSLAMTFRFLYGVWRTSLGLKFIL